MLTINELTKTYGPITAVNRLSLEIPSGSVFGILGPNGSGKTTTLGMVLGTINPDQGTYSWFGESPSAEARKRIGAILETPNLYPYLNAVDNLKLVAHIKGVKKPNIDELLELVALYERRLSPFKSYSLGMKQRLAIAATMIGNPDVLIFDEPTNGLDPQGIADVRRIIGEIAAKGKTVIFASHMIDEVEKVCSHVAIIKKGNLLASGRVSELLDNGLFVEMASTDLDKLRATLTDSPFGYDLVVENGKIVVKLSQGQTPEALNSFLHGKGVSLGHLAIRKRSLESEFLNITK